MERGTIWRILRSYFASWYQHGRGKSTSRRPKNTVLMKIVPSRCPVDRFGSYERSGNPSSVCRICKGLPRRWTLCYLRYRSCRHAHPVRGRCFHLHSARRRISVYACSLSNHHTDKLWERGRRDCAEGILSWLGCGGEDRDRSEVKQPLSEGQNSRFQATHIGMPFAPLLCGASLLLLCGASSLLCACGAGLLLRAR